MKVIDTSRVVKILRRSLCLNNRGRRVMVSFSLQPVGGPNVQRVVTQPFVQTRRNAISQRFNISTLDITQLGPRRVDRVRATKRGKK